jgi:hypothetical protein
MKKVIIPSEKTNIPISRETVLHRETVPFQRDDHFFLENPTIKSEYILKYIQDDFKLTMYEQKIVSNYFYDELNFDKSFSINPSSSLIQLLVDFARFSNFH